jgi:hypothetical protein
LRAAGEAREASVVGIVRSMVLEALRELGDGRWAPWEAVAAYVRADSRTHGLGRLIDRWAQRASLDPMTPAEIARRVALESLHVLGLVDLGDPEESPHGGPTLRITPRGRVLLADAEPETPSEQCRFLDNEILRIGPASRVGSVIALSPFVEIGRVTGHLDLAITPQALTHALSAGFEAELLKTRLEAVAALPDPIERMLVQASAVIGRAEFVATQAFLWVEDPEIREMLRTRRQTSDLFIDPSPPSGLLVVSGVDIDRVARRCRTLGVEVIVDGDVYRTRTIAPPGRGSGARKVDSSSSLKQPPSSRNVSRSGARVRRSSTSLPAIKRNNNS